MQVAGIDDAWRERMPYQAPVGVVTDLRGQASPVPEPPQRDDGDRAAAVGATQSFVHRLLHEDATPSVRAAA